MQIKSIFDKMDYGLAPESALEAQNWLKKHKYNFGNFINGKWRSCEDHFDTINPSDDWWIEVNSIQDLLDAKSIIIDSALQEYTKTKTSGFKKYSSKVLERSILDLRYR